MKTITGVSLAATLELACNACSTADDVDDDETTTLPCMYACMCVCVCVCVCVQRGGGGDGVGSRAVFPAAFPVSRRVLLDSVLRAGMRSVRWTF